MGILLSKRKLTKGRFSLYLDCNIAGKRYKESLGITRQKKPVWQIRQN